MSQVFLDLRALLLALSFFRQKVLTSLSIHGGLSLSLIFFLGTNSLKADQKRSSQLDKDMFVSTFGTNILQGICFNAFLRTLRFAFLKSRTNLGLGAGGLKLQLIKVTLK